MPSPGTRTDLASLRWKATGSLRAENQWPGGPRSVACLGCGRTFSSRQRDERLCGGCRDDGVPDPLDQRIRPSAST